MHLLRRIMRKHTVKAIIIHLRALPVGAATVLYAVKKITKERAQNQELNHTLHLIEQDLKNWN